MDTEQTSALDQQLIERLNNSVISVLGQQAINGIAKSFVIAKAIKELRELLTPEVMKEILVLQGSRLGFMTDKDRKEDGSKGEGYSEEIVKECAIEALLLGLQLFGNEFNVIESKMYPTKSGTAALLRKVRGLDYAITNEIPKLSGVRADVVMVVSWKFDGQEHIQKLSYSIKTPYNANADFCIGVCTSKARKWLLERILSIEIPEWEVTDTVATVVSSTMKNSPDFAQTETASIKDLIEKAETKEDIEKLQEQYPYTNSKWFANKLSEISALGELRQLLETKGHLLNEDELRSAKRIIDKKESNSFSKLMTQLKNK